VAEAASVEDRLTGISQTVLNRTALHDLHVELGGKLVEFGGYEMPVQYPAGIIAEHQHTRDKASLFDVSHMGQARLAGETAAVALESLVCGDVQALRPNRMRYTLFTNADGGILDDLMVTRLDDGLFVVVNAACKQADIAHMRAGLGGGVTVVPLADQGLLALQGPAAADVLSRFAVDCRAMPFMSAARLPIDGIVCLVTRSGYTGEDGFEISVPGGSAEALARHLLDEPEVEPAGLGARDSLRLEAGLCLYGHDIDTETTPVEAGLSWAIGKRRRAEGGFPGAEIIQAQLAAGPARKRVGIRPEGRVLARQHTKIANAAGQEIGAVTSGGFGPSVGGPVAIGYVRRSEAAPETEVSVLVRGNPRPARVAALPFVAHRYYRGN
jgi:aminomethyltransferase